MILVPWYSLIFLVIGSLMAFSTTKGIVSGTFRPGKVILLGFLIITIIYSIYILLSPLNLIRLAYFLFLIFIDGSYVLYYMLGIKKRILKIACIASTWIFWIGGSLAICISS